MNDFIEKITHTGKINIGGKELKAMVSQSGKRLITASDVFFAVGRTRRGQTRVPGYPAFIGAKNLIPFIDDDLREKLKPVKYKAKNGKVSEAYDATIIPRVADLYIEAYNKNSLTPNQLQSYNNSLMIVRSLAKLGITALIDEATGFQYDREGKALQLLLNAYINDDLSKWHKKFPDDFYKELYRLNGWKYNPKNNKRPGYAGSFTKKYVYGVFPEEVLIEIGRLNPSMKSKTQHFYRQHKHFQYLTPDVGIKQLDAQLNKIIVVMKMSNNMKDFDENFRKIFHEELRRKQIADDAFHGQTSLFSDDI
ncbi:hypothetical protein AKUH1B104J_01180 [Apilactobacillus kunkeei]|nr:hypothetical protein AKUH1B104J_01180 [Apilactobacillus kunkeei]